MLHKGQTTTGQRLTDLSSNISGSARPEDHFARGESVAAMQVRRIQHTATYPSYTLISTPPSCNFAYPLPPPTEPVIDAPSPDMLHGSSDFLNLRVPPAIVLSSSTEFDEDTKQDDDDA